MAKKSKSKPKPLTCEEVLRTTNALYEDGIVFTQDQYGVISKLLRKLNGGKSPFSLKKEEPDDEQS